MPSSNRFKRISNLSQVTNLDASRTVLELAINQISEDLENPRREKNSGFAEKSLMDLASSIKERGVKSPITVKPHPDHADRYIIQAGARRYRASLLAGKFTIPAIIDEDFNSFDKVIENIQREDLEPREIAQMIDAWRADGMTSAHIASQLGKSEAWVSQHATLNRLPEILDQAYDDGVVTQLVVVAALNTLYSKDPEAVVQRVNSARSNNTVVSREDVKALKGFIEGKKSNLEYSTALEPKIERSVPDAPVVAAHLTTVTTPVEQSVPAGASALQSTKTLSDKGGIKGPRTQLSVLIEFEGFKGELLLRKPADPDKAVIRLIIDGEEIISEEPISKIKLLSIGNTLSSYVSC